MGLNVRNVSRESKKLQDSWDVQTMSSSLVGSRGSNTASVALDQLASQDRYQDLLSEKFQEEFGLYAGRLKEEHEQLTSHYDNMWSHHISRHPDVSAFFSSEDTIDYEGWGFKLGKPFAEICADASFRNRFINTTGFYTSINQRLVVLRAEAERFQAGLAEELLRHRDANIRAPR